MKFLDSNPDRVSKRFGSFRHLSIKASRFEDCTAVRSRAKSQAFKLTLCENFLCKRLWGAI